LFTDTQPASALTQFLATPHAAEIWAARGGYLSPNRGVDLSAYPDLVTRWLAQSLMDADEFVYDLDDQIGGEMQRCIWSEMLAFAADQSQKLAVLERPEACAARCQGLPHAVYPPLTAPPWWNSPHRVARVCTPGPTSAVSCATPYNYIQLCLTKSIFMVH
jgi:hypothetical protein